MTLTSPARSLVAPILVGAARIALGLLWLHEGIVKYRAHFGRADIELVVQSAAANSRVPGYFGAFSTHVLDPLAGLFGVLMPLLEVGLGTALVAGLLTLPVALMSAGTLMMYWSADQLIGQYPVMVVLSVVVIAFPVAASRFSVTSLVAWWAHRGADQSMSMSSSTFPTDSAESSIS